jgi:hypothetical protein
LPILGQQFLRTDQALMDVNSIGAFHNALGAVAATDAPDLSGQIPETLARFMEVALKIIVGKKAQFIRNRYSLRAFAFALEAHPAI